MAHVTATDRGESTPAASARRALVCEHCDEQFTPTNKAGPEPRYCSGTCRQRAFLARRGQLVHVAWRNERTGALHPRKFGFERDGGPGRGWVKLYAWRGEIEQSRERVNKRARPA